MTTRASGARPRPPSPPTSGRPPPRRFPPPRPARERALGLPVHVLDAHAHRRSGAQRGRGGGNRDGGREEPDLTAGPRLIAREELARKRGGPGGPQVHLPIRGEDERS